MISPITSVIEGAPALRQLPFSPFHGEKVPEGRMRGGACVENLHRAESSPKILAPWSRCR